MKTLISRILVAAGCCCLCLYASGCTHTQPIPAKQTDTPAAYDRRPLGDEEPSARYFYLESRMLLQQNRISQAIAALEKAIQADPESAFLRQELILIYHQENQPEKALRLAEELAARDPDNIETLLMLSRLKQDQVQDPKLPKILNRILERDPLNRETYLRLGKIYMESQQFDKAQDLFSRMVGYLPDYYVAHFYLGEACFMMNNLADARSSYEKSIDLEPALLEPRFRLIDIFKLESREENTQQILSMYEKILEIDPENDRSRLEMALLYFKNDLKDNADDLFYDLTIQSQTNSRLLLTAVETFISEKRYDDAIIVFSEMLNNDPENENLHFFLAMAYESIGKTKQAVLHYGNVTPSHPQHKKALLTIAFLYRDMKQVDKGIGFLEYHYAQNPEDIDIVSYLSAFYEGEGLLDKAMALLENALVHSPKNTVLMFRLGSIQDKAGMKEACLATMRDIIEIDPEDASALNYLGYTYADMGIRLDEAYDLISRALALRPDDGYIIDSMGWVYFRKQEYDKAVAYLERAALISGFESIIAGHLGDAYMKVGRMTDALDVYRKALENIRDHSPDLVEELTLKIQALESDSPLIPAQ